MNPVVKSLIDTVGNVNTRPVFCPAIYDLKPRLANCDPADSGPFSMASKIYSGDMLLTDCILNGSKVTELMRFCTDTIKVYMKEIIRNRIDVMIFDSFVSSIPRYMEYFLNRFGKFKKIL